LSSLSQFFSVQVIYWVGGRLKLLVRLVLSQATLILCVAMLPLFPIAHPVGLLLICLILAAMCGGLAGPAWGSLMSDYVPAKKRGQYFGWRNRAVGTVTVASIVASGLLLNLFHQRYYSAGFWMIFSLAAAARYCSGYFISRMDEPPHRKDPANDFTFIMFLRRFRESNFLRFVVFSGCLTFATYLAAPFFRGFHVARFAVELCHLHGAPGLRFAGRARRSAAVGQARGSCRQCQSFAPQFIFGCPDPELLVVLAKPCLPHARSAGFGFCLEWSNAQRRATSSMTP
jgi:MFS family permease